MKIFFILFVLLALLGWGFYRAIVRYPLQSLKAEPKYLQGWQPGKSLDELTRDLVARMTPAEKRAQLYGEKMTAMLRLGINLVFFKRFPHMFSAGNKRLGIPPFVLSDGPRGARVSDGHKGSTTFPVAIARGASWNVDLEARVHDVIAKEIRAIGANMAATPCINLLRHPGWGRAQEVYGEDPFHMGEFGVAATKAVQAHNVMASPKHYALNSIENSRFVVDVRVDERTLHEVYLPHFKKVVQQANTASLMTAYNRVNGEYCSENPELIRILKEDWGFEGFLHSDWVFGMHNAGKAIKAGLNIEMPVQQVYSDKAIKKALAAGEISEADIDQRVFESLRVRLDYALREDTMNYSRDLLACEQHAVLAREAAEESMVLLKNDGVLPFDSRTGQTIVVIGRLAESENTGDRGSSNCSSPCIVTPAEGIRRYHLPQGNAVIVNDGSDLQSARKLAENADQVVIIVGFTAQEEGEYVVASKTMERSAQAGKLVGKKGIGGDRDSLSLPHIDETLIQHLAGCNPKTVISVVCGSAVDMTTWQDKVPAILFSWYAGMEGGTALANVLWGDVSPSGKLPFAIPANSKDYPYFTPYTMEIDYGYYHGYTLFDKKNIPVAYPFGFGLSYTSFTLSSVRSVKNSLTIADGEPLEIEVTVENTGTYNGAEVIQLYIGFPESSVERPKKILRAFRKVNLQAGEKKTITLTVPLEEFARYAPESHQWEIDSTSYDVYVGTSSAEKDLHKSQITLI